MKKLHLFYTLTFIFYFFNANSSTGFFKKNSLIKVDEDFENVTFKTKKSFSERVYHEFTNSVNFSFLSGRDANLINQASVDLNGKKAIFPRIAYGFKYYGYLEINDVLDVGFGIGFDFMGFNENQDSLNVQSFTDIESNLALVRTDYIPLNFNLKYRPTNWLYVRSGVGFNILVIPYVRTRRIQLFDTNPDNPILFIDRSQMNNIVPSVDFGLGFGKNKFVSFDMSVQYNFNVTNVNNFQYFLFKTGINLKFNMIPDGAGTM